MPPVTKSSPIDAFDLTRGIAAFTGNPLVAAIARVIARHPEADIGNAFNHKQVACKMWARDKLFEHLGGRFDRIWIVGGWYGILAAMLLHDARFNVALVESIDIDPSVETVARTMTNADARFRAATGDMYKLDYQAGKPDLVINTSCEHIADLPAWLALLSPGTKVLLQSNDYFSEPTHFNCMASLQAFKDSANLREVLYAGELPQKKYTRFMLIGRV